ncbi:hypothetical protein [Parabacteroides sp. AM08-6]|uniref:hypothetical protein n=1 Tax=Parabacteroides sp. AM08-6 TaxID=2292053 RepID=UPI0011C40402|nr:hypothetical protein [Parabacteroides sp. AM08-6]
MKTKIIISLSTFFLLLGCSSIKISTTEIGTNLQEVAINNAVENFSTNCNLFKNDSVFSVNFEDSVFYKSTLIQADKTKYKDGRTHQWERGDLYDGIVSVEIVGTRYKYYYSEETKDKLPTKYVIKNGKLFYWWDDNYPVTEEIITVLWKYNILQKDYIISEFLSDDSQKGAHYYFCKNDLSKYKRVVTNIGLGYYKPPKLKCN